MKTLHLRFGGYQKPASIHNQAATFFGQRLSHRLKSELEIDLRFELIGDVLALGRKSGDLPGMVQSGELDCCYISTVRFTRWVPELAILELPFVVRDRDTVQRALKGSLGEYFQQRFGESSPFTLLGLWDNGFRHFSNRIRPIRTPADCIGIKIRTQMSASHGEALGLLGFVPIAADVKEFVDEIAGDRFEAQDNPLTNTYNFGVHQFHRYITMSGHFFGASGFIFNAQSFADFNPELRQLIQSCALEANQFQHQLAAEEDALIKAKLNPVENEIITLSSEERLSFVSAMEPILVKYRATLDPQLFAWLAGA